MKIFLFHQTISVHAYSYFYSCTCWTMTELSNNSSLTNFFTWAATALAGLGKPNTPSRVQRWRNKKFWSIGFLVYQQIYLEIFIISILWSDITINFPFNVSNTCRKWRGWLDNSAMWHFLQQLHLPMLSHA